VEAGIEPLPPFHFSEGLEKFGAGEVGSGDDVQERTEAPGGGFAREVKAWNRRLETADEDGTACRGSQGLSHGSVEELVTRDIGAIAGGYDHMIDDAFSGVAELEMNLI